MRLTLLPVIVCGGGGSRLWPLSRAEAPKPFVRPPGADESLLAQTYARLKKMPAPPPACVTVAASGDVFLCREVAAAAAPDAPHFFVGEPERRDTAPAVVAAAAWIARLFGEDAAMLVLPADHLVGDPAAFWRAAECAAAAARNGHIALLGVVPESPATGYGYIECGEKDDDGCFAVRRFVEKPNEERAAQFLADGNFFVERRGVLHDSQNFVCGVAAPCAGIAGVAFVAAKTFARRRHGKRSGARLESSGGSL